MCEVPGSGKEEKSCYRSSTKNFLLWQNPFVISSDPNALYQVANFHLRNGAQLHQINWLADLSTKRMKQSYGLMVNYKYNLDELRQNNEDYLLRNTINTSSAVKSLLQ
jgi:hypothetical protein